MAWVRRNIHDVLFITALQIVCLWMGCSVAMGVRTLQAGSMFVDKKKIQKYQFSAFSLSPFFCVRAYMSGMFVILERKNADGLQLHYSWRKRTEIHPLSKTTEPQESREQPTSASTTNSSSSTIKYLLGYGKETLYPFSFLFSPHPPEAKRATSDSRAKRYVGRC